MPPMQFNTPNKPNEFNIPLSQMERKQVMWGVPGTLQKAPKLARDQMNLT